MSQLQWIYVDDFGVRHTVGLYHGHRSGNLVVYCNGKILFIDFGICEDKKYNFFIGDEYFDLVINRFSDKYTYGFIINEKEDTPRNRARKKLHRREWMQAAGVFCLFFVLVLTLFVLFQL